MSVLLYSATTRAELVHNVITFQRSAPATRDDPQLVHFSTAMSKHHVPLSPTLFGPRAPRSLSKLSGAYRHEIEEVDICGRWLDQIEQ
jgi:hypothetical protein